VKGWMLVDMKNDWKIIYAFDKKRQINVKGESYD
jgi:hypothetical protein